MDLMNECVNSQNIIIYGFDKDVTLQLQTSDGTAVGAPTTLAGFGRYTIALDANHQFHSSGDKITLYMKETDATGNFAISGPTTVTYTTTPPIISINQDHSQFSYGKIHLTGSINAFNGADRVAGSIQIYDGTEFAGSGEVFRNGSWAADVQLYSNSHVHSLTAQTTDAAGNAGISPVSIMTTDLFGSSIHDPLSTSGNVYELYHAILGRAPDPLGAEDWISQLDHGASLLSAAAAFLSSAEGQSKFGQLNDTGFVQMMYNTALGRHADTGAIAYWTNQIAQSSRADVAVAITMSPEHLSLLRSNFAQGVAMPDVHGTDVARLYYGVLGRTPDAAGLDAWTTKVDQGQPLSDIAQAFLASQEGKAALNTSSASQFVDALYVHALNRHASSADLAYWSNQIGQGHSLAMVATDISESFEARVQHLSQIELNWLVV